MVGMFHIVRQRYQVSVKERSGGSCLRRVAVWRVKAKLDVQQRQLPRRLHSQFVVPVDLVQQDLRGWRAHSYPIRNAPGSVRRGGMPRVDRCRNLHRRTVPDRLRCLWMVHLYRVLETLRYRFRHAQPNYSPGSCARCRVPNSLCIPRMQHTSMPG
jgi:hypothetical protein